MKKMTDLLIKTSNNVDHSRYDTRGIKEDHRGRIARILIRIETIVLKIKWILDSLQQLRSMYVSDIQEYTEIFDIKVDLLVKTGIVFQCLCESF